MVRTYDSCFCHLSFQMHSLVLLTHWYKQKSERQRASPHAPDRREVITVRWRHHFSWLIFKDVSEQYHRLLGALRDTWQAFRDSVTLHGQLESSRGSLRWHHHRLWWPPWRQDDICRAAAALIRGIKGFCHLKRPRCGTSLQERTQLHVLKVIAFALC